MVKKPIIEHGISVTSIIIVILLLWAIRWGSIIVPQIRATANQVANINNLQKVDICGEIAGCIPVCVNGTA
jgi:hypothetical protein